ncbi:putative N-acetylmannosamine-6-phosphate 2-epimerase [Flavimobilis sp. GY10621]|uniref:N-acylglucosamine-6-phosphate 2-epimerase n=1 Tax=Flavimobilis rhizosphaerae TaxID=2775421 RepID=A0ABR9DQP2_9MICO|nr:putative N-acetylmannosamine-6-phosphate 2-epimerase [Flavimobilis rhizosphaerae]
MTTTEGRRPVDLDRILASVRGGLVVSCQAPTGSPLRDPAITAVVARAVLLGGAAGLRVNGPDDVAAVRAVTDVPVIGLHKVEGGPRPFITPTPDLARGLVAAGADVVAADASVQVHGPRLDGFGAVVAAVDVPVMADVSTLEEGLRAAELGAALVGTTLSGYTPASTPAPEGPDLDLVAALAAEGLTVVAEGRIRTPEAVAAAFDAGAAAVVVGGAITDPLLTARRFAAVTPRARDTAEASA